MFIWRHIPTKKGYKVAQMFGFNWFTFIKAPSQKIFSLKFSTTMGNASGKLNPKDIDELKRMTEFDGKEINKIYHEFRKVLVIVDTLKFEAENVHRDWVLLHFVAQSSLAGVVNL